MEAPLDGLNVFLADDKMANISLGVAVVFYIISFYPNMTNMTYFSLKMIEDTLKERKVYSLSLVRFGNAILGDFEQ